MRIRSLGWAGFEVEASGARLLIDALGDPKAAPYLGEWAVGSTVPPGGPAVAALVTHMHRDHADAATLQGALPAGAPVLAPEAPRGEGLETLAVDGSEHELAASGLEVRRVQPWEQVALDPFTVTAIPAVDGIGEPQLSWLVEADGVRILHGGDTMWHGHWWNVVLRHGPVDCALLPANGPEIDFPHRQPAAGVPAALTPEQAVEAAHVLGARRLVPMHYGTFAHEQRYRERLDVPDAVRRAAERHGLTVTILAPGDELELEPAAAPA